MVEIAKNNFTLYLNTTTCHGADNFSDLFSWKYGQVRLVSNQLVGGSQLSEILLCVCWL